MLRNSRNVCYAVTFPLRFVTLMLDFRSVYLNEQTSYKGKGRRVKIGIAKKVNVRLRQTEAGLPGKWSNICFSVLFFARATENHLHKKYADYHTPLENLKPGSGGSEIYTISSHQLAILRLTLGAMSAADYFISFTAVSIFCKLIYLLWYLLYT